MKIAARAATVVAILLAALIAHPLPAGAHDDASRTSEHTIDMDGWKRPYLLRVPPKRSARGPRPLTVALHGGLNDPEYVRRQSGLDRAADEAGYAVAYPAGLLARGTPARAARSPAGPASTTSRSSTGWSARSSARASPTRAASSWPASPTAAAWRTATRASAPRRSPRSPWCRAPSPSAARPTTPRRSWPSTGHGTRPSPTTAAGTWTRASTSRSSPSSSPWSTGGG